MSKQDATKPENIKIMLLKGQKGDAGETYDDTEIRNLIRGQNAAISDLADLVNSFDGLAILEDMATVEDSPNGESTHAYNEGDWLIYNSQLYKATTSIAIGNTLEEGVNLEAITIGEVLNTVAREQFNMLYGLINKTSSYTEDANGIITGIVETSTDAVATTTFARSGTTTTITTTIVPTQGEYDYTKTTVIVEVSGGQTITESYTRTAKEV